MEKQIDVNKFLFGRTNPNKKLEVLDNLSSADIKKASAATILRIYNECRGDRDRFYIKADRQEGNDWNSNIEFIYEYNNQPYLCLYVQSCSSDSSTCVSFNRFNNVGSYEGYCENLSMHFTYYQSDIVRVIRCILKEYVYWKYFEKEEREEKEMLKKVLDYKIINPICNYFFRTLGLSNLPFSYATTTSRYDKYCKGKQAVDDYGKKHVKELAGKSAEELKTIYMKVFNDAI